MSIVVNYGSNATLFIKGASELVLTSCNQWYNSETGEVEPITAELQDKIKKIITKMA